MTTKPFSLALSLCGLLLSGCGAGYSNELKLDLGDGAVLDVVKTPDGIWWGKFEVTQEQWEAVVRRGSPVNRARDIAPDKPVYLVTFDDVDEFLRKLNQLPAVRRKGLSFRLPDKSEWDAACLAGGPGPWPRMNDGSAGTLDRMAWYDKEDGMPAETHSVGLKEPNAYGLFDMLGNVSELTTTEYEEPTWEGGPDRGRWCAGGDVSTPATDPDFEDGARGGRGVTGNGRIMYCGFRVCASGSGYIPPAKSPVMKKDPFHVLDGAGASDGEQSRKTVSPPPKPQGANETPRTAAVEPLVRPGEELTDEKILEIAKKKSDQLLAAGDIAGARKALEDAKALVELRNEPTPEEQRRRAAEAAAKAAAEQERIAKEQAAREQAARAAAKAAEQKAYEEIRQTWKKTCKDMLDSPETPRHLKDWASVYLKGFSGVRHGRLEKDLFILDACDPGSDTWNEAIKKLEALREEIETYKRLATENTESVIREAIANMVPIPGVGYKLGKYPVTCELYATICKDKRMSFPSISETNRVKRSELRACRLTWKDSQEFLAQLNDHPVVRKAGMTFRLPTEKEWEIACLAGASKGYGRGADGSEINSKTFVSQRQQPNAFGLYNMFSGGEWTSTVVGGKHVCKGGAGCYVHEIELSYKPETVYGAAAKLLVGDDRVMFHMRLLAY